MARKWKVLLCGYYGMGNLGDELLLSSCIELLNSLGIGPDKIAVMSGSTVYTKKCYNVESIDRWNLNAVAHAARNSETLLLGGGGIFQDSSSFKSPIYYWLIVKIAQACGCKIWAVGQSVGPLRRWLSWILTKNAFSPCKYISVRDIHSTHFVKKAVLTNDLALSLDLKPGDCVKDTILVNFRHTSSGIEYMSAKDFSAINFPSSSRIIGVGMSKDDAKLMQEMRDKSLIRLDDILVPTKDEAAELFSRGQYAFGMRLHFGVLCLKASVPCTMVPYDLKVKDFATNWGADIWQNGKCELPGQWRKLGSVGDAASKIRGEFSRAAGLLGLL